MQEERRRKQEQDHKVEIQKKKVHHSREAFKMQADSEMKRAAHAKQLEDTHQSNEQHKLEMRHVHKEERKSLSSEAIKTHEGHRNSALRAREREVVVNERIHAGLEKERLRLVTLIQELELKTEDWLDVPVLPDCKLAAMERMMEVMEGAISDDAYDADTRDMDELVREKREARLTPKPHRKDEEGVIVNVVSCQVHKQMAAYEREIRTWEDKYEQERQVALSKTESERELSNQVEAMEAKVKQLLQYVQSSKGIWPSPE